MKRLALILCALSCACGSTTDTVGLDGWDDEPPLPDSSTLRPLTGPSSYPNAFRDVLGRTDQEIRSKIDQAYQRLFHGDPASEAIYFTVGDDLAFILDVLHGDVRSEGIGLGMLITLQLDKREEFDRLWRFARASLEFPKGDANRGYFRSSCGEEGNWMACADPYGHQTLIMALLLAHGRWGSRSGTIDYGGEMLRLLQVMRSKEQDNGGVVDGVIDMIDPDAKLVHDVPHESSRGRTRPSSVMPGYYALWAQATGDPFWADAASRGREHLEAAAHPQTGLIPQRARFDGTAVSGSNTFQEESYRALLNVAIDQVWIGDHAWNVTEANRLVDFFYSKGVALYCASYSLDGSSCLSVLPPDAALIAVNGVTALVASSSNRNAFISAAWDVDPPPAANRYYGGILHLLSLLILAGEFRVY